MFECAPSVDIGLQIWPILLRLLASHLLKHKSVSAAVFHSFLWPRRSLNVDSAAAD